ncbi:uncharacterized protein LOC110739039 [Chenopodium quinoa]|uniref:uncharacterized protein LOC110739039 n=1 Tax=Chenopodium quinoa TaxID=63459 RepID=UPI000B779798|nr:uncharacterized protein LOC110739039 [Chenopodium quinoa]
MQDETGKSEQNVTKDISLEKNTSETSKSVTILKKFKSRKIEKKKTAQNDPIVDPELLKDIDKSIGTDLKMSPLPSEQSENIPATHATTKIVSATHNTTDKESRDQSEKNVEQNQDTIVPEKDKHDEDISKQKQVQPEEQSNPDRNTPEKKDKNEVDQSKQEEVQPKMQSNPEKNSLGQKKPKDDARITTLKDKMQEIHLDIERNPKKYKESTIKIMRNLKRMEKASKEIRRGK